MANLAYASDGGTEKQLFYQKEKRKRKKDESDFSCIFLACGKCTAGMVRGKLNKILCQLETEEKLALTSTVTCYNCTLTQQTPVALPVLLVTWCVENAL